jgi:hypothetical protein
MDAIAGSGPYRASIPYACLQPLLGLCPGDSGMGDASDPGAADQGLEDLLLLAIQSRAPVGLHRTAGDRSAPSAVQPVSSAVFFHGRIDQRHRLLRVYGAPEDAAAAAPAAGAAGDTAAADAAAAAEPDAAVRCRAARDVYMSSSGGVAPPPPELQASLDRASLAALWEDLAQWRSSVQAAIHERIAIATEALQARSSGAQERFSAEQLQQLQQSTEQVARLAGLVDTKQATAGARK